MRGADDVEHPGAGMLGHCGADIGDHAQVANVPPGGIVAPVRGGGGIVERAAEVGLDLRPERGGIVEVAQESKQRRRIDDCCRAALVVGE